MHISRLIPTLINLSEWNFIKGILILCYMLSIKAPHSPYQIRGSIAHIKFFILLPL